MASKAPPTSAYRSAKDQHAHAHDEPHVISIPVLVGTFMALLALTGITVGATAIDLGATGNLFVALAIAAVKAILVALIFMHLWFDQKYNVMIFFGSIVFVILFVSITMLDVEAYQPDIRAVDEDTQDLEQPPLPTDAAGMTPTQTTPTAAGAPAGVPAGAPAGAPGGDSIRLPEGGEGPRTAPTAH